QTRSPRRRSSRRQHPTERLRTSPPRRAGSRARPATTARAGDRSGRSPGREQRASRARAEPYPAVSQRNRGSAGAGPALPVIDELSDLDEGHTRTHAVETGNAFDKLVVEEPSRQLVGVPQIDVRRAAVLLIDGEGLLAESRQALETAARLVRDRSDTGRV